MKKLIFAAALAGSLAGNAWPDSGLLSGLPGLPGQLGSAAYGASDVTYSNGATGSVARTVASKLQDNVNGKDFGMKCDGATDDTAALQAAENTGKRVHIPPGTCVITNAETISTKGQIIEGDGEYVTTIKVTPAFERSARGLFVAASGEEGPIFRDFGVTYVQPDTSTRSSLTNYPPAFYLRATPRFKIQRVRVSQAMMGIDMAGGTNSGGAFIDELEMSAYNVGIDIDGSLDSVHIDRFHFWPFDLTRNQTRIFNDRNAIGIRSGRADDFHLSNSIFLTGGTAVKLIQTSRGNTFGEILNTDFDTYGGLAVQSGDIRISSSIFTVGFSGYQAINETGGSLSCSSCKFYANVATRPLVEVSGSKIAYAQIDNSMFQFLSDMQAVSVSASSGNNTIVLTGNQFLPPQNMSPTNPIVNVGAGGRITAVGNRVLDKGSGSGNFLSVAADNQHIIANNSTAGWGISLPATLTNTVVAANSNSGFVNKLIGSLDVADPSATTTSSMTLSAANDANGVNLRFVGNGATSRSKTIRVANGSMQFLNDAYREVLLQLVDGGRLIIGGAVDDGSDALQVGGSAKVTGNLTATGIGTMPLYSMSGAPITAPHAVSGSCTLSSGSCTVSLSGPAVFGAITSYICTANDTNSAAPVGVQPQSASSVRFVGTAGDNIGFLCIGN